MLAYSRVAGRQRKVYRATDKSWAAIEAPAIVTGGCDPVHPTEVSKRLHFLLPISDYHDPVVTTEEWDSVFNVVPYPEVSILQGERIPPCAGMYCS